MEGIEGMSWVIRGKKFLICGVVILSKKFTECAFELYLEVFIVCIEYLVMLNVANSSY